MLSVTSVPCMYQKKASYGNLPETKTLLPSQFKGRQNCSTVVDANNYIWIMWEKQLAQQMKFGAGELIN